MITNEKTKTLAYIRKQIRNCVRAYLRDEGLPHFYNCDNHECSKRLSIEEVQKNQKREKSEYYYVKSNKIINKSAEKIFDAVLDNI